MTPRRWLLAPLVILAIVGCERASAGSDGGRSEAAAAGPLTRISLAVTGGERAGSYEAETADAACSEGLAGRESWGVQYTEREAGAAPGAGAPLEASPGLASLQLVATEIGGSDSATSRFGLGLVVGRLLDGTRLEVETRPTARPQRGRGSVRIRDSAGRGTVTVEAITADSVRIEATIQCDTVRRLAGADEQ
jgi:hypothetical protein